MNEKLKAILEERKKAKGAKKPGFKQPGASKVPADAFKAPKDGPKGAGPKDAKSKTKNESAVPAFGARFNSLFETTMATHQSILAEDDASDLYYEFNDEFSDTPEAPVPEDDLGDLGADLGGEEEETVTLTMDKATAQKLIELLTVAVGSEEGEEGAGEGDEFSFGGEDEVEEEGSNFLRTEKKDEEDDDEKEVVEEEGHYEQSNANLGAGEKLANPGSKVVKSKLGARPGKAGTVKTYDSSGKLTAAPTYKKQEMSVKSNISSVGKDLF